MRRLLNDFGSILLALGLAIIVWIVAVNEENPMSHGPWAEPVPVEVLNQPSGTIIVGAIPDQVQVTIRASQKSWQDLRPESFRAYVDLSEAGVGMNQVEVQVECSDKSVEIRDRRPGTVAVRLEKFKQVELPVKVDVLDSAPFGFEIKTDEISATPDKVTVSGPEQLVNQVTEVVADFYLRGANETLERKVTLQARDEQGGFVGVNVQPNVVVVKVPIVQRRGFRNLSVRVVWEGQPAPGYRISNVSVDPTIVTAIGDPVTIESIPGYLETSPVTVDGATADVIERVPLVLPENVSVLGLQAVQVTVSVTPIESSLTVQRQVVVQGLSLNLDAVPSPASVDVILSGPLPKLDSLRPQDVQVIVDLFNLEPGSYQIVPIVIVPEGITVQSVVPEKIQVEIAFEPTETPTATATATLTATATHTSTPTVTVTPSPVVTATITITVMPGITITPGITVTPGITATFPLTVTPAAEAMPASGSD